jgi:hypothetical protein
MSEVNPSVAGLMPEFYDRFLVPLLFEPFAQDLAERLRMVGSGHLLELTAGPGVATRTGAHSARIGRNHRDGPEPGDAPAGQAARRALLLFQATWQAPRDPGVLVGGSGYPARPPSRSISSGRLTVASRSLIRSSAKE